MNISQLKIMLSNAMEDSTDLVKLSMPAILYIIQNNLQYIIETRIVFLVMYQLKIITTALFYSNMLSKRIHYLEWWAIVALTLGMYGP
jgi:UDP-sugar transporter A1/2/3